MFSPEIIIPIIVVALVCVGIVFWRMRKNASEHRVRVADKGFRDESVKNDPLTEPSPEKISAAPAAAKKALKPAPHAVEPVFAPSATSEDSKEKSAPAPSDEPPIYRQLEAEEEAQKAARAAELAKAESEAAQREDGETHTAWPPVDSAVQWVLDIAPREGMQFALGGVKSLKLEVERLELPLAVHIWAQSSKDGLYYNSDELTAPARHVAAALVLANRSAKLDDVAASRFFQVLEQSAAQNDVALRREMEPEEAVKRSLELKRFIEYFDRSVEVRIIPPEGVESFELDAVAAAAEGLGLKSASGRWELRLDGADSAPVMTLAFGADGTKTLSLMLRLPLASAPRGDLQRFFALANALSCALGGSWTDCSGRTIDAGGAMLIADSVAAHAKMISKGGVIPGSARAKLLFSR